MLVVEYAGVVPQVDTTQVTGETELGRAFGTYASAEQTSADRLRIASVLTALLVMAAAALIVSISDSRSISAVEELGRLALTSPLAALAAYFRRESARHRAVATWASAIHVQLRTIDAYSASFADDAARDALRLEFGRQVFLTHSSGPDASAIGASAGDVA